MESNVLPNNIVIVHVAKNCPKYKQLVELFKDEEFKNKLKSKMIDVSINHEVMNPSIFKIDFYDHQMHLIKSFPDANHDVKFIFYNILQIAETKTGGGRNSQINYEQKYKKYKKKYLDSKNKIK